MDGLGPIDIEILIDNPALFRSLTQGERDFHATNNRITQQAQATSNQLDSWAKKAATVAASYFSITAAKNFIAELVSVRGEFEQLQVAYETILRSKSKGDALFAETAKFAATTPFNFTDIAKGSKQLLAYGFTAGEIISTLTTLGNVASGVSAPLGDIVYLYGTLKTQGRAYAQDIRQFTSRGIPIIAELAKQFKVNEDQVNKLVEAGKVGFPEIEKAFQSLTSSSGIFYNLSEKQSKTLTGQLSNLQDKFEMMLNSLGQSSEGILVGGIAAAADLIDHYQDVLDIVEALIITYGTYRAVLLLETAATAANSAATTLAIVAYRLLRNGLEVLNAEKLIAITSTAAYTAVIAALVIALKSWHDASELQNSIASETNQISGDVANSVTKQKIKIDDLTKIINDHNNTQEQRLGALKKLNEISPEYLGNITLETANTKAASKAIKEYLADLNNKLVGEAAYNQKLENLKKIADLQVNGTGALTKFEVLGNSLKNTFGGGGSFKALFSGEQNDKEIVAALIKNYQDANAKIDAQFGKQIKDSLTESGPAKAIANKFQDDLKKALAATGVKAILDNFNALLKEASNETDLEALRDGLTAKLKALAPGDPQIAALKQRLAEVKKILDTYSLSADAKAETSAFNAAERYGDLMQKIYQLNDKYNASALTDNEQKLQAIRSEYARLGADIDKYNANPKNTRKINKGTLQANELAATNNQAENNETKDIAEALETQKALYQEYYNYRDTLGKAAADKQYGELLAGGKDFETYINTIQALFLSSDLTPQAYEERQKLFVKYGTEAKRDTASKNLDLLGAATSYYQQLAVMDEKYLRTRAELVKTGDANAVDEYDKAHQVEVEQLEATQADKLAVLQRYNDNVMLLTKEQAKAQLQALREAQANSNLTPGENSAIDKTAASLEKAMNTTGGLSHKYTDDLKEQKAQLLAQLKTQTAFSPKWRQILADIANVNEKLEDQSQKAFKIGSDLSEISGAFSTLSEAVGGVNSDLGETLNQLSQVAKIGSDVANSFASFSKHDVVGGITSAIGAISGIFSLFSSAKQNAEQQQYANDLQLKQTEAINKALERQLAIINNIYGPDRLTAYGKQLADIAAAQIDAQNKINKRLSLTGVKVIDDEIAKLNNGESYNKLLLTNSVIQKIGQSLGLAGKSLEELNVLLDQGKLDEHTAAIVQGMLDLQQQAVDTLNGLKSEVTGTTFDEITDSIVNLFANGTTAVEDFGKNFEETMNKAVLNSFKRDVLQKQLQGFFDEFYNDSKDGLDSADIAKLKALYDSDVADFQAKFEALQKATGLSLTTPGSSSNSDPLAAGIKGITSDEASVLSGTTKGIQLAVLQIVTLSQNNSKSVAASNAELAQQTILQRQIAANTKRTADNTEGLVPTLKSIETKMSNNSNALAANGRTTI